MAGELSSTAEWLYQVLSADATLVSLVGTRIYDTIAPQSCATPFILFSEGGSSDTVGVAASRIFVRGIWLVKAVDQSESFITVTTISDRIDAILQKHSQATVGSNTIYSCSRLSPMRIASVDNGIPFRQTGGLYRIITQ
jgi:hypothetical protein